MLTNLSARRRTGPPSLVELLAECHGRIRHFVRLAGQVAARRDARADQIAQACADVERYFVEALPLHVADEEASIAPRLRGLSPEVDDALHTMAAQHRRHDPKLAALLRAAAKLRGDPQSEGARLELATAAGELEREFEEHLALEESVIFTAIQRLLAPEAQAAIVGELRQRRGHELPHAGPSSTRIQEKDA